MQYNMDEQNNMIWRLSQGLELKDGANFIFLSKKTQNKNDSKH
jgi:hypothetical protein